MNWITRLLVAFSVTFVGLIFVLPSRAIAGNPSFEGPVCVANAQRSNVVSGYAYFIPNSLTVGPGQKVSAVLRTYVCNGTQWVVENDYNAFGDSFVESTGRTGVVDFAPSGLPVVFGFRVADMGGIAPGAYSYRDINVEIDGSAFTGAGNYIIKLKGFGSVYYQQWQNGYEVGCGADGNPITPTDRCTTNEAYASYNMTVVLPPVSTYDGTISIAKYRENATLGQFPAIPSDLNNAKVRLTHTPPGTWESPEKTSNPGVYNNIWVNPNNHESNTKGNYRAYVKVPKGWKVVRATNRGSNVSLNGSCGSEGDCYIGNVTVDNNGTTYIDFFFEPDIRGSFDGACPSPSGNHARNGKAWGWVIDYLYEQQQNEKSKTPSQVRIRITEKDGNGNLISNTEKNYTVTADVDRPDLPVNTNNPKVGRYHGFDFDIPLEYFNGKNYDIKVFPLRNNAGIGSPPYLLGQRNMNCPPPIGAARCFTDQSTKISYLIGWGLDPRRPGQRQSFKFYYDNNATFVPVAANEVRNDKIGDFKNSGYPGVVDNSDYYGFKIPVPDKYHDGQNHTLRIYLSTLTQPDKELNYVDPVENPLVFGPNKCGSGGSVDPWFWPWLQTQNGDVIASGKITGQLPDLPGSRPGSVTDKEAEYLIISALKNGNGGPFCSTYQYILTNTSATGQGANCSNGIGYDILNKFSLGSSPADDAVIKSIETSYNTNGAGNSVGGVNTKCSPFNTFSTLPSQNIDTVTSSVPANNCINGTIFKLPAGSLGGFKILAGRMTIFIDGNVTITDNIIYQYVGYSDPRAMPNLAIIVRGDVNIGPGVTQLDAAVYATGRINTCSSYNPANSNSTVTCNNRLSVNGMLVGKDGFTFGRSFYNQASRLAAEFISLTGQTVAFPPPGLDSTNFENFDNSVQIDSGEFQPRF